MAKPFKKKLGSFPEPRINDELHGNYDVRVIMLDDSGNTVNSVMPLNEAKHLAFNIKKMDLIEINPKTNPPLMRIAVYEKWLYAEKKKAKENKQPTTKLKEIQLTATIGKNDMNVKAKQATEFINDGNKVKVVLTLRGREKARMEESKRSLYEFLMMLEDVAVPESMPKDEGGRSIVILKKKK